MMGAKLTSAQVYWLRNYVHGWTLPNPRTTIAPIRRLIARGLIAQTGMYRGRPYFAITDAGRTALGEQP